MGIFEVLTELPGAGVALFHLRCRVAFGGSQRCAQGDVHVHFSLDTIKGLWEHLEQRQPCAQVTDGFHIGGPLDGSLTSFVPIADRLPLRPASV